MKKDIHEIAIQLSDKDKELFLTAFEFAKNAHTEQLRKSGRPYITHPVAVAKRLWEKYQDINLAIAGLLHDTTEDCEDISMEQIYTTFGNKIGFLVDSVDKNQKGFYKNDTMFQDKIERLLWAGTQDIRVLLLKLVDREHNINTLSYLKDNKQVRLAFETQAIFAPLKQILDYNKNFTVDEIKQHYAKYLKKNNLVTPSEIKKFLYNMSFKELSDEMYNLVYNNSDRVVWEIEDKNYFKELTKDVELEGRVNIESMWTDGKSFKVSFTFEKGYIANPKGDFKISSYKN